MKYIFTILLLLILTNPSQIFASVQYDEFYDESYFDSISDDSNSTSVRVETEGNADIKVNSNVNSSSTTTINNNSSQSVRVESKNGETKSEVIIDGKKVYEGDKSNIEINSDTTDKNTVDVTTDGNKVTVKVERSGNNYVLKSNDGTTAESSYKIEVKNNKAIISTPSGTKEITLEPDEALNITVQNGDIDVVDKKTLRLEEENGNIVYVVKGIKNEKFLRLLPTTIEKELVISARNGEVLFEKKPLWSNFLDAISQ